MSTQEIPYVVLDNTVENSNTETLSDLELSLETGSRGSLEHEKTSMYESMEPSHVEKSPSVEHTTDSFGRRKYIFQESGVHLRITVFAVGIHMVNVNDIVMPLKEFVAIRHMHKETYSDMKDFSLDAGFASYITQYTVICDTDKNDICAIMQKPVQFSIPNTTINLLSIALAVLYRDYGADPKV
jgi:hypothetical protein